MKPLEITHVVAGLGRQAGGVGYSVPALVEATRAHGASVKLRTVDGACKKPESAELSVFTHSLSRSLLSGSTRASASLRKALEADAEEGRIFHVHGLWQMPNVYPAWERRRCAGARLIYAPRGMLGEAALRFSAWKKKPFWWMLQRSALQAADCLHATARSEYQEIRAIGLKTPVAIVPNGIDLPEPVARIREGDGRVVLSLGRLHPKKGLDRLVRGWSQVEADFPNWSLRMVGPSEDGYEAELRDLARSLRTERISIENAVYGAEKLRAYRSADLFVLPSLNENFALTVAEALAAEVPVISTKGAPWEGLDKEKCGWWIEQGVEPLADALRRAMRLSDEERHAMGQQGRVWMARDFGWERVGRDMMDVYTWVKYGGEPPGSVIHT